jgi:hypothetical protein
MGDEEKRTSRRGVLKVVAGSGAAAITLGLLDTSPASAAPPDDVDDADTVVGTVAATSEDMLKLAPSSGADRVVFTEHVHAYSGAFGRTSSAQDFIVGDQVVAQGVDRGGVLEAIAVGSIFRDLEVRVRALSGDGSMAYTDYGTIDLSNGRLPDDVATHRTRLRSFVSAVRPGRVIRGSGWTDPRDGKRYFLIPATT